MGDILTSINTRKTPQGSKARSDQVRNNAGGYVFQIGDEARLMRFLTLGTDEPTYYQKAIDLTRSNAEVVFRMAASKPDETIKMILDVSEAGRAPKNKQAIFALAICASAEDTATRVKAMAIMHRVCRIGTHVFEFNKYVEQFRGRGPSLNKHVGNWYKLKNEQKLAYQLVKYRARQDWSHRDLLRLVKGYAGKTGEISAERDALLAFSARDITPERGMLPIVDDYLDAKAVTTPKAWVEIINRGNGVAWEMLPDAAMKSPEVWEAMIARGMPQTALMRQLPRLSNVFGGTGSWVSTVAAQLADAEAMVKARVHPVNVLVALKTYASGRSVRGSNTWTPITDLVNALDAGFYAAFGALEPLGQRADGSPKRILLALDVSASMTSNRLMDYDEKGRAYRMPIDCAEAGGALVMATMAAQAPGTVEVVAFTSEHSGTRAHVGYTQRGGLIVPVYQQSSGYSRGEYAVRPVDLSPRRRLDDNLAAVRHMPHGGTDCALPFTWASKENKDFDAVVIYTDNETWAGPIHVHQAATNYRNQVGHDVKLIAVGLTATEYSVVDPKDNSGLNVAGFDSAVPQLINDFADNKM